MPNQEFNSSGFLCSFGFPFQSLCLSTNSVLFIFFMVDIDLNLSGFVQFTAHMVSSYVSFPYF